MPDVPPVFALLPSPLLGPSVWAPVADVLRGAGHNVVVPTTDATIRTPVDVIDAFDGQLPSDRDLVLVPHSNAGLYVPVLTRRRRVVAQVFVDAGLPPRGGSVPLTPPALYRFLTTLADEDGLLPPWTRWWPADSLEPLFPDATTRRQVEAEQPRLPLAYFRTVLAVAAGWDDAPGAYLAFGDTYAAEREDAAGRGWPTATVAGGHLHMLVDPPAVATAIESLLADALSRSDPPASTPTERATRWPR